MIAADLFALGALKRGTVEVRGQVVHIRELSVGERSTVLEANSKDPLSLPTVLVSLCVTDESGAQVFTKDDREKIAGLSREFVDTVAQGVMKLSGMDSEEDPAKNA